MLTKFYCFLLLVNIWAYGGSILPPEISDTVDHIYKLGQNATLSCRFRGNGTVTARWTRNGTTLKEVTVTNSTEPHVLYLPINDIIHEDEGDYKCEVSNDAAEVFQFVKVIIEYPPIISVTNKSEEYAAPGANVSLICQASGTPDLHWNWYFNGSLLDESYSRVFSIEEDGTKLRILDLTDDYYGKYTCEAVTRYGTDSYNTTLMKKTAPRTPLLECNGNNKNAILCKDMNEIREPLKSAAPDGYVVLIIEEKQLNSDCCKPGKTLMDCGAKEFDLTNSEGQMWIYDRNPGSMYVTQALGKNSVGSSLYSQCVWVSTDEASSSSPYMGVTICALSVVLVLAIVIDVVCCLTQGKGLSAYIYRKLHHQPDYNHISVKDIESNAPNVVLLKSAARDF